ncbi:hypothetical protein [Ideonella paludis]|uniref:hypothetical protein n=1 Tax=Ideonella paludis TaxID=1233411 RepID=UPI003632211E
MAPITPQALPPVLCLQDEGWTGGILAAPEEGVNLTLAASTPVTDVQAVVRLLLAAPRRDATPSKMNGSPACGRPKRCC